MSRCFLALGSNVGDRRAHLASAVVELDRRNVRVVRSASIYSTEPQVIRGQPWFLNTVVEVSTDLTPLQLLRVCQDIENVRRRSHDVPNGPRTLDIDIILELLNIDPDTTKEKLERDLFGLNDATFNEVLRGIYGEVGRALAENSDVNEIIAEKLGLKYAKPSEDGGRF